MTNPTPAQRPVHPLDKAIVRVEQENLATRQNTDMLADYYTHLADISNDPTGTALAGHLGREVIDLCLRFGDEATNHDWQYAEPIDMRVGRLGQLLWKRPMSADVDAPFRGLLLRRIWQGRGYHIGTLGDNRNSSHVMLCPEDSGEMTLRCARTPQSFPRSRATGYGRLPDSLIVFPRPKLETILARYLVGPPREA